MTIGGRTLRGVWPGRRITDLKDVNRALRRELWGYLKAQGFQFRTDRAAWRYLDDAVDVIEVPSVGSAADAIGCTPFSFTARAAALPTWVDTGIAGTPRGIPTERPKSRPHYWDAPLQFGLSKGLAQPWFEPFTRPPGPGTLPGVLLHREGLMKVLRRDRHDRPDVWFVKEDGSNLDEVVEDLRGAIDTVALPRLGSLHDHCQALPMLESGLLVVPDSPVGRDLRRKARDACRGQDGDL